MSGIQEAREMDELRRRLDALEQQKDEWANLFTDANHRLKEAEAEIADAEIMHSALIAIAHTFTEDSHGNMKTMPADWYQRQAKDALSRLAGFERGLAAQPERDA